MGKALRSEYPPVPEGARRCPTCAMPKPLSEWPSNRRTASGYGSQCRACHNAAGSEHYFRRTYGLSRAEVERRRVAQDGLCAMCYERPAEHVDHNRATGQVRGLLCFNCNGGLGQFRDEIELLELASNYLESHRPARDEKALLARLDRVMSGVPGTTPRLEAARALLLAGSAGGSVTATAG